MAKETTNYKVDESYEYYLNNWMVEMDLVCTNKTVVGFMITFFFIGIILNSFITHIPDVYGRRLSVIYGTGIAVLA